MPLTCTSDELQSGGRIASLGICGEDGERQVGLKWFSKPPTGISMSTMPSSLLSCVRSSILYEPRSKDTVNVGSTGLIRPLHFGPAMASTNLFPRFSEVDSKPEAPAGLTLESWSQGFMVGALLIMTAITLVNMRRGVLLHKLILLEVSKTKLRPRKDTRTG